MTEEIVASPAEIAAQRALSEMYECIRKRKNFRLEAGAGAGKTYSLIKALKLVTAEQGQSLLRRKQQVACITFTNVATDEIVSRTDSHPVIQASTIHSFCWGLIRGFQVFLRAGIPKISAWDEKLEAAGGVGTRIIDYDLGHRSIKDNRLFLHHDDILTLSVELMMHRKFRKVLSSRFPILFIDEYQDTNAEFAASIVKHFINPCEGPLIGLFGDSWQKIYSGVSGLIEDVNLQFIGKEANFRSAKEIVYVLNKMRPDLPQEINDPDTSGSVAVYHSNDWVGIRRKGTHWEGDLPPEQAHIYLDNIRTQLAAEGWDFSPEKTKILMLTHNLLGQEQNYGKIVQAFRYSESYVKKEDPHIAFLIDTIEPMCNAFQNNKFGEMFEAMGTHSVKIQNIADKRKWIQSMTALIELREKGTIGAVLDYLKETHRPRLPEVVYKRELDLSYANQEQIAESLTLTQISKLREIPYTELIALALFVNDHTPFSTKHGVKGAEFENVLAVLGRGWNHYNWNQFIEWFPDHFPRDKAEFFERNRNLFYVICSRSRKRLALLFTQKLSPTALCTLQSWFGNENVNALKLD